MSSSCALVPRAGAACAPRAASARAPRAAAGPSAAGGRAAERPRHPLSARTVAASRARVGRWVGARRARAPRAQDASRAGTSGISALSVEDRQNDGDGADEPIEAIVVDPVEASDPMANERDAEDASTVGKPGGYDEDGVPLVDDGPCTTTEDGDEVCELPFPFAPPGETAAPSDPADAETPTASVVDAEIENDHPTARAAALMRGALPSDDAVIASTLGVDPTRAAFDARGLVDPAGGSVRSLWWRALKLPMYSVAIAPLTTAAAMCHHWFGCVNAPQLGCFLGGACLVIAWLNLANDAWDHSTGVDANDAVGGKPESVVRLLGGDDAAARKTHVAATVALLAGCFLILKGVRYSTASGMASTNTLCAAGGMLVAAVALGHAYQGPPFRLSYKGVGEPICFAAFGPLAVGAFYLLLASGVPGGSVWGGAAAGTLGLRSLLHPGVLGAAALVGLTTTAILFASHLHQEEGDRAAGKMSPVVRLGVPRATAFLKRGLIAHHVLAVAMALGGFLPVMACVSVALCAPLAYAAAAFAEATAAEPKKLFKTKYLCVRWHVAHAAALGVGCWLDPWMPWHLAAGRIAGAAVGAAF